MVLSMSRPFKRPETGVYYFRKAVPADLKAVLGKDEVKHSLGTKDQASAKRRFAEVAAKVDAEWAELRRQNVVMSRPALTELDEATIKQVGEAYFAHLLDEDEEQRLDGFGSLQRSTILLPESVSDAEALVRGQGFRPPTFEEYGIQLDDGTPDLKHDWARGEADSFFAGEVDEVLAWDGFEIKLVPSSPSRKRVIRVLQAATLRAREAIAARNQGQPIETPSFPPPLARTAPTSSAVRSAGKEQLMKLFEDWWREAKATGRKPSTYESYKNTMTGFVRFLGHDDAETVAPSDVVAFKDHRLSSINPRTKKPISPKTVKDSDLAALKTVLGWALSNHRLPTNAADGITIKVRKPSRLRSKGFTDEEAVALLDAADDHKQGQETKKTYTAKRWVPWLAAYTGARVGELAQLRKQDVRCIDGHHVIHITPEAGTVKTDEARDVVLHPHLVKKGFLEFVSQSAGGHLFLEPASSGDVLGPLQGVKNRLAEFARETVTDVNVKPTHGWRHRFKTLWREAGLDPRIMDAIQGHAPKTVGDSYGDVTAKAQSAALARFPTQGGAKP